MTALPVPPPLAPSAAYMRSIAQSSDARTLDALLVIVVLGNRTLADWSRLALAEDL